MICAIVDTKYICTLKYFSHTGLPFFLKRLQQFDHNEEIIIG